MSLWNPYAFTPTGERASVAAPPALRVIGGPASPKQMGMAQAAFAQFCGRSRVSFWRNPNEQGLLPDGSRYKIMVVGNSTVMTIWPVNVQAKPPGKWGILLTTTINGVYVNKLFTPGGDYDHPDGTWVVTDVMAGSRDAVYATSAAGGKFPSWAKNRTFALPVKRSYITSYGGFSSRRFLREYPAFLGSPLAAVDDRSLLALEPARNGLQLNRLTLRNPEVLFPPADNPLPHAGGGAPFESTPHQYLVIPDISDTVPIVEDFCISKNGGQLLAIYRGEDEVVVPGVPNYGDLVRWIVPEIHQLGVSVSSVGKATYGYTDMVLPLARPRDKYVSRVETREKIAEYRLQGNALSRVGLLFDQSATYYDVDPVANWQIMSFEPTPKSEYPITPDGWGDFQVRNFPVWSERSAPLIPQTNYLVLEYDHAGVPISEYWEWQGNGPTAASEQSKWKSRNVRMNYYAGNERVVLVAEGEGSFSLDSTGTYSQLTQSWSVGPPSSETKTHTESGSLSRTHSTFVTLNSGEKLYLRDCSVAESGSYSYKRANAQRENNTTGTWNDTWITSDGTYTAKLMARDLYVYDPSLYLLVYVEGAAEHAGGHSYSLHSWEHEKGGNRDTGYDDTLSNNCPLPEPKFNLVIRFGSVKHSFPIRISATDPLHIKEYKLQWGVTCGVEPQWNLPESGVLVGNWGLTYGTPMGFREGDLHDRFVNEGRKIQATSAYFASVPRCVALDCAMPSIEVYYAKDPWTGAALLLIKPYQTAGGTSVSLTVDEPMAFAIDRQGVRRVSAVDASVAVNQTTQVNPE